MFSSRKPWSWPRLCVCVCGWVRARVCVHACINCHTLLTTIQHIQSPAQSHTPQSYTHSLAACLLPHHACVCFRLVLDPKRGQISHVNAQTSGAAETSKSRSEPTNKPQKTGPDLETNTSLRPLELPGGLRNNRSYPAKEDQTPQKGSLTTTPDYTSRQQTFCCSFKLVCEPNTSLHSAFL